MKPNRRSPFVCFLIASLFAWGCREDPGPDVRSHESQKISGDIPTSLPGEAGPADRFMDGLKSGDMASRKLAAEEMCRLAEIDEKTLNELQALLKAESPLTRIAAAYTLG